MVRRVPSLTGIRFFAALHVFIFHFGAGALDRAGVPEPVRTFAHNGYFGVTLFFILSGFILAHAHPGLRLERQPLRRFFLSRFARLYPVYCLALLVSLPFSDGLDGAEAIASLVMLQSWTSALHHPSSVWLMPAWTLSVEMFFYLTFPFLLTLCRRLTVTPLLLVTLLDAVFLIYGGITDLHPGLDPQDAVPAWVGALPLPVGRYPEFVFGVTLFCLIERFKPRLPSAAAPLCAALAVGVLASTGQPQELGAASILVGLLIVALYLSEGMLQRLLGSRPIWVLGSASYALYLLQVACHGVSMAILPDPYGRLLALPLTVLASLLIWRLVEEPARKLILQRSAVKAPA